MFPDINCARLRIWPQLIDLDELKAYTSNSKIKLKMKGEESTSLGQTETGKVLQL